MQQTVLAQVTCSFPKNVAEKAQSFVLVTLRHCQNCLCVWGHSLFVSSRCPSGVEHSWCHRGWHPTLLDLFGVFEPPCNCANIDTKSFNGQIVSAFIGQALDTDDFRVTPVTAMSFQLTNKQVPFSDTKHTASCRGRCTDLQVAW